MARNPGGPVEVTGPAYWAARHEADNLTDLQLRWTYRRLRRQRDQLGGDGLAQLQAYTDELRARGQDLPS